jgi:hypothetical protein
MNLDFILYILAGMIFYDFSLHVYDLLHAFKKTKAKHPLGAYLIFDYFSKGNEEKKAKVYQVFWTIYWGLAFILLLAYLLFR